jgi:hypothetical protein
VSLTLQTQCFICGLKRSNFDRHGLDFEAHRHSTHNVFNYLFLRLNLERKIFRRKDEVFGSEELWGRTRHIAAMMRLLPPPPDFELQKMHKINGDEIVSAPEGTMEGSSSSLSSSLIWEDLPIDVSWIPRGMTLGFKTDDEDAK